MNIDNNLLIDRGVKTKKDEDYYLRLLFDLTD